jgi:hypothetical protein
MENEFTVAYTDGMARIVTAIVAGDDVEIGRQYVDDFAFSFIAPLGADNHNIFHRQNAQPAGTETQGQPAPKQAYRRAPNQGVRLCQLVEFGISSLCLLFRRLGQGSVNHAGYVFF